MKPFGFLSGPVRNRISKPSKLPVLQGTIDQVVAVRSRKTPPAGTESTVIPANRLLYVRGWAVGSSTTTFALTLEGLAPFVFVTGLPRPDVAKAIPSPHATAAGFEAFLDIPTLAAGSHQLALSAFDGERVETLDTRSLRVADPRPRTALRPVPGGLMHVDRLWAGSRSLEPNTRGLVVEPHELVTIEGWAIDEMGLRTGNALYALIDDRDALPVAYGFARDDVADAFATPDLRLCGFRARIDPAPSVTGSHTIRLIVLMDDGSALSCADTFALVVKA